MANKKFLERISDIITNDPKIVRIINVNRGKYAFAHYDKIDEKLEMLVNVMGYQFFLDIKEKQTKIRIQPIILTEGGWVMVEEEQVIVVEGKEHLIFKPIPEFIDKFHKKEMASALSKIQEKLINKETTEVNPIAVIYEHTKKEMESKNNKVGPFKGENPELMDFTKWEDDEENSED